MHLLIIEDDQNNALVIEHALLRHGITSTSIQDPTTIDDVLETIEQIDIVILDLELPEIDGYQMFERLRHEFNISVPIVACTVHHNEIQQVRKIGFSGFLGKPVQLDKLTDQLMRIFNGEEVWEIS